jgi:exonuclease III
VWKYKYISNCISTNSAGVITLYNNDYETIETYSDKEGRHTIVVLENEQSKFIVSNAYFPNDHKIGINFAETVYLKILEFQHTYPEHDTISGGDYNLCMTEHDSLNRNKLVNEKLLSETITYNNEVTNLDDAYRKIHSEGGFTWKRGKIYSRLDHVFVSTNLLKAITNAEINWSFEQSDHASLLI